MIYYLSNYWIMNYTKIEEYTWIKEKSYNNNKKFLIEIFNYFELKFK